MANLSHKRHLLAVSVVLASVLVWLSYAGAGVNRNARRWSLPRLANGLLLPPDTINRDSLARVQADSLARARAAAIARAQADSLRNIPYEPSRRPTPRQQDRLGDPFAHPESRTPFYLDNPSNIKTQVQVDDSLQNFIITEKAGSLDYRPPVYMTYEEYSKWQQKQAMRSYWRSKAAGLDGESEVASKRIIPKIHVGQGLDRIFGGNFVDIRPNGNITLRAGARFNYTENPNIPVRVQRTGDFDFDQAIALNLVGKVGEKLKLTVNYDTKANFEFENNLKLEYTGYDEEIIRKIEAGNVSLPINGTLIRGAQNLFGVKTQMQFGRLSVTSILSNQRGRNDAVEVNNGAQIRDFEIRMDEYDENRHYFLSDYFRDNYNQALARLPFINSQVMIRRLEVYVTNTNTRSTEGLRNIVALMDLGEPDPYRPQLDINPTNQYPDNSRNRLYQAITGAGATRNVDNIDNYLLNNPVLNGGQFERAKDFERVNNARKLNEREYRFNERLGYISLNTTLQPQEVLAVAFEYTVNGQTYKVGELIDDYQNLPNQDVIYLKLLKATQPNLELPTWDLMMKNVYSLNAGQVSRDQFVLDIVYKDDETGVNLTALKEGNPEVQDVPLVDVMNLDNVGPNNDPPGDGNFDFIEGLTIDSEQGRIYFPVVEPFGDYLASKLQDPALEEKYVFDKLYDITKNQARQYAAENKFFLVGQFQASLSDEIRLPGIRIARGSVAVYAGGTRLTENVDYTVNYDLGTVKILNQGYANSGQDIRVDYEKADLLTLQPRTLMGARLDYRVNKDLTIGGTILHLNERTYLQRVSLGDEPTNNTIYGVDFSLQKESRFLTRMVDAIPGISTKEPSTITASAEFAQLLPGKAKLSGIEDGTSYIDDFEGAKIPNILTNQFQGNAWRIASTPQRFLAVDPNSPAGLTEDIRQNGFYRAKMAWYSIDPVFFTSSRPDGISDDDMKNHYVRGVLRQEVFPFRSNAANTSYDNTFDIAYFPAERGQYNYNANPGDLLPDGRFARPSENWAGISRGITYDTDFENANVQFLEFWLMDPFINTDRGRVVDGQYTDENNTTGGDLFFNLGNISEDVMMDNRNAFENGLPLDEDPNNPNPNNPDITVTPWGRVTRLQNINDAFDNSTEGRDRQDVGLDGLNSNAERDGNWFGGFVQDAAAVLVGDAFNAIQNDPSSDDFRHFLDENWNGPAPVLRRYKSINNMERNSSLNSFRSYTSLPDKEDLNNDNTINNLEAYWEYRVPLRPGMDIANNPYIIDKTTSNSTGEPVTWYQFRIPIREAAAEAVGGITDFRSIRFIRMYLANWEQPVVLRMMQFQFVANQWRKFPEIIGACGPGVGVTRVSDSFTVGTVNIEENGAANAGSIPYVLPPGINRQENLATINQQLQNEQSLQLCVENLLDQYTEAVTKNVTMDMLIYKQLKLFLHAEGPDELQDGDLNAMVRIGTDNTKHYYELLVPLKVSRPGASTPEEVWPYENNIDIPFQMFVDAKVARNSQQGQVDLITPYSYPVPNRPGWIINVVGNPDFSDVRTMLIGIQNPCTPDKLAKSACVWVNELRVADFNKTAGWAATGQVNTKLADFANIVATGSYTAVGFGGLEDRIQQRARDNSSQFDVAANITADKFLPTTWGIKVPMSVGYGSTVVEPRYNPLDGDVELRTTLNNISDPETRREYREKVISRETRRNINFINVRKDRTDPKAKPRLYDVENLSLSYAYNDVLSHDPSTQRYFQKNYRGGIAYTYNNTPANYAPFGKVAAFDSPYLKLIRDINFSPMPSTISVRAELDRTYSERYRQRLIPFTKEFQLAGPPTFIKSFYFNRIYDVKWSLTKSLTFDYTANNRSIIDEPEGKINKNEFPDKNEIIWRNLKRGGRNTNFNQTAALTYRVPLDKFPLTNWLSADVRYAANFSWRANSLALTSGDPEDPEYVGDLGNFIENSSEKSVNGRIDLVRLYDKVKFLKDINKPLPAKPVTKNAVPKAGSGQIDAAKPGQPAAPGTDAKADSAEKKPRELKALKAVLRAVMTARSVNFTYTLTEGTQAPGYLPSTRLFGFDREFDAPGLPFILGRQYELSSLYNLMASNGWYTNSSQNLTQPFRQMATENITARTALEPFKDFNIQVDARRQKTRSDEVFYRYNEETDVIEAQSPVELGDYNASFIALNTFFEGSNDDDPNPKSEAFEQLIRNRNQIQDQLNAANPHPGQYGINSQDVLIPAFIYAYTGRDVSGFTAKKGDPFKVFPLPNWRVDYNGLSNIAWFQKYFSSINLTHGYTGLYSVGSYISSLLYEQDPGRYPTVTNNQGDFVPYRIIGQVMITERFSPLIGINVRTKGKLTARVEYKRERNLSLDLTNAQVTETGVKDYVIGIGYVTNNFRLPFKIRGENKVLKNDITTRLDFTIRDNKTILRRIEDDRSTNTFTNGAMLLQIKPTVDYVVNQRLNVQFYFTRTINAPKVSNSFLNTRTEGGIQVRYNLTP